ncbi:hypothetical protein EJV46_19635 [Roseococcus sp. SYP-B2431]|uniref:hypothetical protein n=1 Tax=Roseococcus sp. SYP-B2431 TaxID=2496640 RepID=UPI00103D20C2|nr:hypothetical protein [Roseococcus sp. SYP-B2431]TCH96786.1 hypothetical protein EJV46_19635 [Roseococcus sp. SYP-B2431]
MTKWFLMLAGAAALAACSAAPPDDRPAAGAATSRPACDGTLRVTNSSTRQVHQLFFADSALSSFGRDRLGNDILSPGQSRDFRADGPGAHDFRIVRQDRSTSDLRRANICTNTQVVITNYGIEAR